MKGRFRLHCAHEPPRAQSSILAIPFSVLSCQSQPFKWHQACPSAAVLMDDLVLLNQSSKDSFIIQCCFLYFFPLVCILAFGLDRSSLPLPPALPVKQTSEATTVVVLYLLIQSLKRNQWLNLLPSHALSVFWPRKCQQRYRASV